MSDYQPTPAFEPSLHGDSRTGLWVALIGTGACLIVACLVGAGWIVYSEIQNDNAAATTRAQNDSATATAQAHIVLPPPGWLPTINEQFVSNQNRWATGSKWIAYGKAEIDLQEQRYELRLDANSENGMSWWAYPDFDHRLRDFYASAECRLVSGNASGSDCGLAFRILDGDNYYKFVIADDQLMDITLVKKGEWIRVLSWQRTDLILPGEANQVAVLVEGMHYRFFINNSLAYKMDNDLLDTGKVGLFADIWGDNEAVFQFDNFQVYEPGE